MGARQLVARRVEKVWGTRDLPAMFGAVPADGEPIGEIWFEDSEGDPELLVKYLFTSEKLSIQVHPGDEDARKAGHKRGKDEAWVILDADRGATIGLGLRKASSRDGLRAAALDGRIEGMMDWKPVVAGESFYSPGGTLHAIGAGLSLIEVQQNVDLTYRLYDYGRPRKLHLDEGIGIVEPGPYVAPVAPRPAAEGRDILAAGKFVVERWSKALSGRMTGPAWFIPVAGLAFVDGAMMKPGSVWLVEDEAEVTVEAGGDLLVAYPGGEVREILPA